MIWLCSHLGWEGGRLEFLAHPRAREFTAVRAFGRAVRAKSERGLSGKLCKCIFAKDPT